MRYKITGAIGVLLGIFISLPAFFSPHGGQIPWGGLLLIVLGVYYLIFKQPPVEDAPEIAPEDRFKNNDPD